MMTKTIKIITLLVALISTFTLSSCDTKKEKTNQQTVPQPPILEVHAYPVTTTLPKDIKWETNEEANFADPKAQKGGVFNVAIQTFPLTFRLYGPNSNSGGFVGYNRSYSMWGLTTVSPLTNKIMPLLATHWALMPDQKTVFYKLERAAKWSDGKAITADDYIYGFEFMQSREIPIPFYNQYARDHFQSVEKVDDYTLKIVSVKPSWRVLRELDVTPMPRHRIKLDKDWVKNYNWLPNITASPYFISHYKKGKSVTFSKQADWWGKDLPRFKGLYNFDAIRISVVKTTKVEFELFKKGRYDLFSVGDASRWVKETDFVEVQKGWVKKQKIYIESSAGLRGIFFNLKDPILKDVKVRKALQHLLDFQSINKKFNFGLEKRQDHFFDVFPPYRDEKATQPAFNIKEANRLLDETGWNKRNEAGIRVKKGKTLELVISVGTQSWVKYLAFYKQTALKAGVDVHVKLLDGAALYKSFGERSYQSLVVAYGGGSFPSPRQFLHSENVKKGTNNLFQYANKKVDSLIDIYEFNLDEAKRIAAIHEIEAIAKRDALVVQFWRKDHARLLWWDYIRGPKGFVSKQGLEIDALWIDQAAQKTIESKMEEGRVMEVLPLEADPYGLK
ncbi:MAG: extracellular solute-binding protein [SAR324 cluster bacterium]|nr:extracellular solute-binding protein [SAR324 cluster bacterium]